ncbi:MAG: xanthan lyase [Bacteroidales bacterium]|nr:xanthan lyase [Bacteroidales bacterium]
MKRLLQILAILLLAAPSALAQGEMTRVFKDFGDSLTVRARERFNVKSDMSVWRAMKRDKQVDIYFDRNFADFPWRRDDYNWLMQSIRKYWPRDAKDYSCGDVYCRSVPVEDLITPGPGKGDGQPLEYQFSFTDHITPKPFVENLDARKFRKGMNGRNIALWHSHGLYYDRGPGLWSWQRTPIFRTYEDVFTQSFVLPFLMPMLENAGAYIICPRERDTQTLEVVCDNDPHYQRASSYGKSIWADAFDEPLPARTHGNYSEKGSWTSAGEGFADTKQIYLQGDNPFTEGTARQTPCGNGSAVARWTPVFKERGEYAVYVSYKTVPGSTRSAHYTVHHLGGDTHFRVDQTKGDGTWIYLGTFEFDAGSSGSVTLDNSTPKGYEGGRIVTADAVRFGGGIGKVACGSEPVSSGMPSHTEGALYWMQWAGAPESLWEKWDGDYTRDYAGRGAWVQWMKGEKGIPVDLSLAFHSDAGVTPNDSIVGTLAIYTLSEDNSRTFKNNHDRMACRFLGDCIQTQLVNDLRADYDTLWRRRQLWDRSYSECRTTDVPGIILELLSHQNFADMRYGLDPQFRFDASRAVYKGMLKFLSSYYGTSYVVQPLPVWNFSALLAGDDKVALSWAGIRDPKEPTATPTGYVVYTRVDGKGWDDGKTVSVNHVELPIAPGHVYSYKVVAFNDGGYSFPSEILSVGKAPNSTRNVLIVNNFTRVSAPSSFDSPDYAGFDDALDGGVPYKKEISFIGEMNEFRRNKEYVTNDSPGFGGSDYGHAGRSYAGNSLDYPYVHGKALLDLGYSFASCSSSSLHSLADVLDGEYFALDIICGKQVSTTVGTGMKGRRFSVFPENLRKAIESLTAGGVNVLISGADIATDCWDEVYHITDPDFTSYQAAAQNFILNTLGFKWISSRGSRDGVVLPKGSSIPVSRFSFRTEKNPFVYAVENPDGIRPADKNGRTVLKYRSSNLGAGVFYTGEDYCTASFGFPLETVEDPAVMQKIIGASLSFFASQQASQKKK